MSDLEYLKHYICKRLALDEFFNHFEKKQFFKCINSCITNPKYGVSSIKQFCNRLDELAKVLEAFDLSKMDIASIIVNEPSLIFINPSDIYYKYLMLGVSPSLDSKIRDERKDNIINRPQDLRTSLNLVYARFRLCVDLDYTNINWSLLLHISEEQFATKFVDDGSGTPYKCFPNKSDLDSKKLMERYPITDEDLTYLEDFDANKEIVRRYHEKSKSK